MLKKKKKTEIIKREKKWNKQKKVFKYWINISK